MKDVFFLKRLLNFPAKILYNISFLFVDVEATEDALVEALIKVDVQKIKNVIITDILAEGDVATAKILNRVFEKFGDTFSDSKDVDILMGLLTDEVIQR